MFKKLVHVSVAGARGLGFTSILLMLPILAQAQCAQWDVGGEWALQQSNGYKIYMNLRQNGKALEGSARFGSVSRGSNVLGVTTGGDPVTNNRTVTGNIAGNEIYIEIASGVYRGQIGAEGRIDGTTYDQSNSSSKATWFSDRVMKCSNAASPTQNTGPTQVLTGDIKIRKDFGVIPSRPGDTRPATSACGQFYVAVLDPDNHNKPLAITDNMELGPDSGEFYICKYSVTVPALKKLFAIAGMGGTRRLPSEDRSAIYITDAWIGGIRSKPPAGYERGFVGKYVTLGTVKKTYLVFTLMYAQVGL